MARSTLLSKFSHIALSACVFLMGFTQVACARTAGNTEFSQIPEGYYDSIDQKSASDLKVALGAILKEHEVFDYGQLWYRYELTDVVPGTDNQVFDYYSPAVYYFTGLGTAPDGANKEHACPQSWWGKGAQCNAYSDIFNVMPSEMSANSAKSNYPLGIVSSSDYSNNHMKVGPSARQEYDGKVFEPCDEYKGDFARIYFYVATCYADAAWGSSVNVASTCPFTQEDYPTIKSWLLDMLLQWNAQDPVSDWEIIRNGRVYEEQHNRNPFIDYPQLADYIWGDSVSFAFDLQTAVVNGSASGGTSGGIVGGGDDSGDGDGEGDDSGSDVEGSTLLSENFASASAGNDQESTGSASAWNGDDDFPTVSSVFQAGGAVKLGSSSRTGSLTSRPLGNAEGVTLQVELKVKGWRSVEGNLLVSIGQNQQEVTYTHTMSEDYETVTVTFEGCPANAELTIATSLKRAFLDAVVVSIPESDQAIHQVRLNPEASHLSYTLQGQLAPTNYRGIVINNGRLQLR